MLLSRAKHWPLLRHSQCFNIGDKMEEVKISSKGQIVIPKYLRDALGMQTGKSLMVVKEENKLVLFAKPDDPLNSLIDTGKEISMKNIRREIKGE